MPVDLGPQDYRRCTPTATEARSWRQKTARSWYVPLTLVTEGRDNR
jgi:hypothetical protein